MPCEGCDGGLLGEGSDRPCVPSLRRVVDGLEVTAIEMVRFEPIECYVARTQDEQSVRSIFSRVQINQAVSGRIERSPSGKCVDCCRPGRRLSSVALVSCRH